MEPNNNNTEENQQTETNNVNNTEENQQTETNNVNETEENNKKEESYPLEKTTVIQKDFPEEENQNNLENQKKEEEEGEKNQQETEQEVQHQTEEEHKINLEEDEEDKEYKPLSDVYSIPDIPPKPGFSHLSIGTPRYPIEKILLFKINEKNKNILSIHSEQNNYKDSLQQLIKKLNNLVSDNAELLSKNLKDVDQEKINNLMNEFNIRKRENNLSLSQNKTYKSQYELLLNKYNNNSSNDKINEIENKINQIRIDNINIIKKIRDLKTKQNLKKKKVEILSKNKKIPHEINTKTDDIQSLNSKKFEYYYKLNQNILSLNNIKIFLEKDKKNYNESGINNKKIND